MFLASFMSKSYLSGGAIAPVPTTSSPGRSREQDGGERTPWQRLELRSKIFQRRITYSRTFRRVYNSARTNHCHSVSIMSLRHYVYRIDVFNSRENVPNILDYFVSAFFRRHLVPRTPENEVASYWTKFGMQHRPYSLMAVIGFQCKGHFIQK